MNDIVFQESVWDLINNSDSHFYTFLPNGFNENCLYDFCHAGRVFSYSRNDNSIIAQCVDEYKKFIIDNFGDKALVIEESYRGTNPELESRFDVNIYSDHIALFALRNGYRAEDIEWFLDISLDYECTMYVLKKDTMNFDIGFKDYKLKENETLFLSNIIAIARQIYDQDSMLFWSKEPVFP